jgi:hypothetical protein
MKVEEEVHQIVSTLRTQVRSLQSSLKDIEEQVRRDAPRSNLFGGPMIGSLLSEEDPVWFAKFLHSLEGGVRTPHLVIATLLAHQQRFKNLLLNSAELQSAFVRPLKGFEPNATDIDETIWYKSLMYALMKSKQDKPRIVAPQFKSAGFTFSEQTKLEESLAHNPSVASALGSGAAMEEWSTELDDANKILNWFLTESLIKRLVALKAGESLACICRSPEYRPLIIRNGGVAALVDFRSKLPQEQPERKEQIEVALARLCMTTDPRIWRYPQVVELGKACYNLIASAGYELYQYEGGIGLTNLLSSSAEVLENIGGNEESFIKFFELISGSQDERVQSVGVELVCNLCCSPEIVDRIANGRYMEQLKILPFLVNNGSDTIQSAASGAMAILSSNDEVTSVIEKLTSNGDMLSSKLHSENLSPEVELRIASIMSNLIDFTQDESTKIKMTDELKALRERTKDSPENERLISLIQSYS